MQSGHQEERNYNVAAFLEGFEKSKGQLSLSEPTSPELSLLQIVTETLAGLRETLDNVDEPECSYSYPWMEFEYEVLCNWDTYFPISAKYTRDELQERKHEITALDEEYRIADAMDRHQQFLVLRYLTNGFTFFGENNKTKFYTPPALLELLQQRLQEIDSQEQHKLFVNQSFDQISRPFTVGFMVDAVEPISESVLDPELTTRLRSVPAAQFRWRSSDGCDYQGFTVVRVYPLNLDVEEKRAYFPIFVGLATRPVNSEEPISSLIGKPAHRALSQATDEEKKILWDNIFKEVYDMYERLEELTLPPDHATAIVENDTNVLRRLSVLIHQLTANNSVAESEGDNNKQSTSETELDNKHKAPPEKTARDRIYSLFNDVGAVYTIDEIADTLGFDYDKVHDAYNRLWPHFSDDEKSSLTKQKNRQKRLSIELARRVAFEAARGKLDQVKALR